MNNIKELSDSIKYKLEEFIQIQHNLYHDSDSEENCT